MSAWPWPPIQIADDEWIIMRHDRVRPKAIVKRFGPTAEHGEYYRAVTWAPRSEDRKLIGRYVSLKMADEAVLEDAPAQIMQGPDKDRMRSAR